VDICSILSTSTLSLKIFRSKYLPLPKASAEGKVNIPILKRRDDTFTIQSYFGGATDYYNLEAENLYYYDVNSLYPFVPTLWAWDQRAMCKPMPFELIRKVKDFSPRPRPWAEANFNLNNFFGFLKVEVNCPLNVKVPVLPNKYNGKTIFPTGIWIGTYLSEELKAVQKYGYQFIEGYEFSKVDLFSPYPLGKGPKGDYVNNFYEQKKSSTGPERFIAKMHLNQLYGIFGRKHDLLETINIYKEDLEIYISSRIIKTIIPINDKITALLMHKNVKDDLIKELNSELDLEIMLIS